MEADAKKVEKKLSPAYVAYKTFKTFISSLKTSGIPNRIDSSVLPTMSGGNQRQLISALRFLKLIGDKQQTTELLKLIVEASNEEKPAILSKIIYESYPFLFKDDFIKDATTIQVKLKFGEYGIHGDTIRKCIVFFSSITQDAGIKISKHIHPYKNVRRVSNGKSQGINRKKKDDTDTAKRQPPIRDNHEVPKTEPKQDIWMEQLLSKFPEFDPNWDSDVQGKWFESFEKLMKVREGNK